ncbi:MAG: type II toxin-antitoxin system HicB family antitoxin [Candidatus Melainabacteria bacterium]
MNEYAYTVVLEPESSGGFSVSVPALPGCFSQGETKEEAMLNIQEAIALYVETLQMDQRPVPPDIEGSPIIETVKVVA